MWEQCLGEEAESELSKVPVSDNTISRLLDDLSNNISGILSEILQNNNFALRVGESTDITGEAQLLAFVRFQNEGEIIKNYFCCKELPETTKGHDVFNILSSYLESCGLSWNRCVGICTDSAPWVNGSVQGFVSRVKEKKPWSHNNLLLSPSRSSGFKNYWGWFKTNPLYNCENG